MARLRIFVSSTCYDLAVLRNQLRAFIESQGHEPVMSDYNDILYDPRHHTHTSCIDEIVGCDLVIVIIGSRFGGGSIPAALDRVDLLGLEKTSASIEALKQKENISITQLEVLKAIEQSIPIFTFVDDRVWHDHATYEKNKAKAIIDDIEFSSIEKPKTAKYIFEFINFLRHRSNNNGVIPFAKYTDIENSLAQQWSFLLKKLLLEQRTKAGDARKIDALTEQFEDLKAAMISTISDDTRRKVALGVVKYRKLYDFFVGIESFTNSISIFGREAWDWDRLLQTMNVVETGELPPTLSREHAARNAGPRLTAVFVKNDNTVILIYFPLILSKIKSDFTEFMLLSSDNRQIILEALQEGRLASARKLVVDTTIPLAQLIVDLKSGPPDARSSNETRKSVDDVESRVDPGDEALANSLLAGEKRTDKSEDTPKE